ncbi:MAG: FAD-dependent oxidoreductase [Cyclobacteriaceae bacterium]
MSDPKFPQLTQQQINTLKEYGEVVRFDERTTIFKEGDNQYDFYVVLSGTIEIQDPSNPNTLITTHHKNEFSGDSSMLSNRAAHVNGYATDSTHLLRVKPNRLKQAIAKHSEISDILLNAFLLRQEAVLADYNGGVKVVGSGNSKDTYEILDFMDKNHIWYTLLDTDESSEAKELLKHFNISDNELPFVLNNDQELYIRPSIERIARCTGVLTEFEDKVFDVLVVGAGPAGLAASVYAASEGLSVVTIDNKAPGGQAGKSSKIENYLGFPTGISGRDLANRAYIQAQKFGCNISIPHTAKYMRHADHEFTLCATNGKIIRSRALIIATGASYRKLPIDNIEKYEGSGVYYSATGMNINSCKNELVGIVGGGNSAGQAAMFLSKYAKEVRIMIRGGDLGAKMSDYLVQRIEAADNIKVINYCEVKELSGEHHLEAIHVSVENGETEKIEMNNLFTFVGAAPCTEWMEDLVITDEKGFICTGSVLKDYDLSAHPIYDKRLPQQLETSIPGLFAVGDVRNGSTKRVASAVGEGSICISQVHTFLGELHTLSEAADKDN